MLTPEEYDIYTSAMARLYEPAIRDIINDAAKRIKAAGFVSAQDEWILQRAGVLSGATGYAQKRLQKAFRNLSPDVTKIALAALSHSVDVDNAAYKQGGKVITALTDNPALMQIFASGMRRTYKTLDNLTGTTIINGNKVLPYSYQRQLTSILDRMHAEITTGARSPDDAIRQAAVTLARNGPAAITYPSGHVDYLDVVVRRALITGVSQTAGDISVQNAKDLGWDTMQISAHSGARTGDGGQNAGNHAWWQGKIVSLSGQPGYLSPDDIGYGTVTGFKGSNCRHDWYPHSPAIAPLYTQAQLDEINSKTVSYNGRDMLVYDAEVIQREMERNSRKYQRQYSACKAIGNTAAAEHYSGMAIAQADRIEDFCEQTGLQRMQDRENAIGITPADLTQ